MCVHAGLMVDSDLCACICMWLGPSCNNRETHLATSVCVCIYIYIYMFIHCMFVFGLSDASVFSTDSILLPVEIT